MVALCNLPSFVTYFVSIILHFTFSLFPFSPGQFTRMIFDRAASHRSSLRPPLGQRERQRLWAVRRQYDTAIFISVQLEPPCVLIVSSLFCSFENDRDNNMRPFQCFNLKLFNYFTHVWNNLLVIFFLCVVSVEFVLKKFYRDCLCKS